MNPSSIDSVTMSDVVGRNVKAARTSRRWDYERVIQEATMFDIDWDPTHLELIESGGLEIGISELLRLAIVLGIAPHLMFYPPPDTAIYVGDAENEPLRDSSGPEEVLLDALSHISAEELTEWLWEPDEHANTHVDLHESDLRDRVIRMSPS